MSEKNSNWPSHQAARATPEIKKELDDARQKYYTLQKEHNTASLFYSRVHAAKCVQNLFSNYKNLPWEESRYGTSLHASVEGMAADQNPAEITIAIQRKSWRNTEQKLHVSVYVPRLGSIISSWSSLPAGTDKLSRDKQIEYLKANMGKAIERVSKRYLKEHREKFSNLPHWQ